MKIIHQSLAGLLQELRGRKVEQVRVAPLIKSFPDPSGLPRYASWVVVSAALDWERWVEWRLLVGRARAEVTDEGAGLPGTLAQLGTKILAAVKAKVGEAGFTVADGLIAHDADAVDGVLE